MVPVLAGYRWGGSGWLVVLLAVLAVGLVAALAAATRAPREVPAGAGARRRPAGARADHRGFPATAVTSDAHR